jgi:1-acyl-sn-glycerol-3-phosphate acyltransferase
MAWRSLRAASTRLVRKRLDLRVENVQNLPPNGPVIIAARHFHHLYDGAVMMSIVPRPLRILVGLDWVRNPVGKVMMERLCRAASWPVVMGRGDTLPGHDRETSRALRQAISDSLMTLRNGHALLVFPEGYPNIDPGYTPKADESVFLPFQPGFVRLATIAASQNLQVPVVLVGLSYIRNEPWQVVVRFGEPITLTRRSEERSVLRQVEAEVHRLSQEFLPGT